MSERRSLADAIVGADAAVPRPRVAVPTAAHLEAIRVRRGVVRLACVLLAVGSVAMLSAPPAVVAGDPGEATSSIRLAEHRLAGLRRELRAIERGLPAVHDSLAVARHRAAARSLFYARRLAGECGDPAAAVAELRRTVARYPETAASRSAAAWLAKEHGGGR